MSIGLYHKYVCICIQHPETISNPICSPRSCSKSTYVSDQQSNQLFTTATTTAMPQGKPISEDIQWIVVRLGAALSPEDIAMYTNISERKVKAILAHHRRTGEVNIPKREKPSLYRKLQEEDIQVPLLYYFCCPFYFTMLCSVSTKL